MQVLSYNVAWDPYLIYVKGSHWKYLHETIRNKCYMTNSSIHSCHRLLPIHMIIIQQNQLETLLMEKAKRDRIFLNIDQ